MKNPKYFILIFAVLVFAPIQTIGQITVIKAGKLVDPENGTVAVNQRSS